MNFKYQTEAFVLDKKDSLDSSRIFSVFTKDFGRLEIFGRGIRKIDSKLRGGIEIFSLSNIEFIQGKNRKTLTGAIFIEKFKDIFENPNAVEISHKISELAEEFIRGEEPDGKIWDLLIDVFEKLNIYQSKNHHCQLIYFYFFWNFISILGYRPELANCVNCPKKLNPYELYFSNKEGGIICRNCYNLKREGLKIKSDAVKVLRLIVKKDWNTLSKLKIENKMQESLKEISDSYYRYLSHGQTFN